MENKTDLRAKIKTIRRSLDISRPSMIICDKVSSHPAFISAENVMLYYPLKYEINMLPLMRPGKKFYFPKVKSDELLVCPAVEKFEKSRLNIYEPCSEPVSPDGIDLVIVPALAVDKENFRLGYGGGFYDRFLAKNPRIISMTPILKQFVFEFLPRETCDIPVNYVISD